MATLRGRFVEASSAGAEETTGFSLEDATVVGADSEGASDLEPSGETINLDMPSAVSAENWVGKEVVVEGSFEAASAGEANPRRVFRVESIDEA